MSVVVPFNYVLCEVSVFIHYGNYNENHLLLLSIGSRWWFGWASVFPFLSGLV